MYICTVYRSILSRQSTLLPWWFLKCGVWFVGWDLDMLLGNEHQLLYIIYTTNWWGENRGLRMKFIKIVLCLAHSRGSKEQERARQGIHVIKGLPYKISTRQGWVLRNWYFKPYKCWEWRSQFKVFTDTSEYTCSICVCAFTQWRSPSCFDLRWIKRLKANEEMLILKMHSSVRIIWICYWGGINCLDEI